ncbi:MAG: hypothetical protein JW869_03960 [Candidatus Omnitrophica bacterium]|nr:hypothetical protein [Candidatus Omnitrophota bacterium]
MGPIDALKMALAKEEESIKLYQEFAAEPTAAQDIFEFLIAEEEKHRIFIQKKIAEFTRY